MVEESTEALPVQSGKWLSCNGRQLRKLVKAGLIRLEENKEQINALNVFPVPDGDTGTNMLMTMQSAYGRIEHEDEDEVGVVAANLAQGALMGARGNSGVILSQIWRGLAHELQGHAVLTAQSFASGMKQASDTAYKGVMRPVEGTILTVIREAADEAADAVIKSDDLRFVLERVVERCQQALERTPEQLPILKQAGVVDSGGQGLFYIFQGMLHYVHGQLALDSSQSLEGRPAGTSELPAQAHAVPEGGELEFPYDVQFILSGTGLDVPHIRDHIDAMGDSTVVVGDDETVKVHIHVKDPGEPLSYGATLGNLSDVVVENMQEQMADIVSGTNNSDPATDQQDYSRLEPDHLAVVAIASGTGLSRILQSLGASYLVNGGQTNNPSTEEILQAVEDLPVNDVIILPNNKNIILAAEAARDLSSKQVKVVPTRSIPQGIGAMLELDPTGDLEAVTLAMEEAAAAVCTGEITRATRSVTIDDVKVEEGSVIGLVDGHLCASGNDFETVVNQMLPRMGIDEGEIVTIYFGSGADDAQAEELSRLILAQNPDLEIDLQDGGQAHYHFILGVE